MNQLQLHNSIRELLASGPAAATSARVTKIIATNNDAKRYFYYKADERWLEWLWKQGFLEPIKSKTVDPSSYGYRMPELNYLVKVAGNAPSEVANFICSFKISTRNFNPEVIDQFTRIAGNLPAESLKKVVSKIRDERWPKLMGSYTQHGFEYADMLETLYKAEDYKSILVLAEAILTIRSSKERQDRRATYRGDSPFYIQEISRTKVFDNLSKLPDQYLERALTLVSSTLTNVVKDEGDYLLMDTDFFDLSLQTEREINYQEDAYLIFATFIELVKRIFASKSYDSHDTYSNYCATLPPKQIVRRLKLFILSLDPKLFIDELSTEYFRLFKVEKVSQVIYGAEYERALRRGFSYLNSNQQRDYIDSVFDLFTRQDTDLDERWSRHYASRILSSISEHLSKQDKAKASELLFKIDSSYQPEPSIGKIRGGSVTPRSPLDSEEFGSLSISDIVSKLKNALSPEQLRRRYHDDDFLNPRDADGVAQQLKDDIHQRIGEYLANATQFFDRDNLASHYTYSFLRGIQETLSENKESMRSNKFGEVFSLLQNIIQSGKKNPFDTQAEDARGRWLAGWNTVHTAMANLLEELIKQKDGRVVVNFQQYRQDIFEILDYLLSYNNPTPEYERISTARLTTKDAGESEQSISDPLTIAINSVRGQAFETLLHAIYQDSIGESKDKLAKETKTLYTKVLKAEDTRSIMFLFGHYLAPFYYRDKSWTKMMLKEIFQSGSKDQYLRLAAWEGYLSKDLYREIFFEEELQKLYQKNISQNKNYPNQKFYKNPHESIAIHLALAFVHYQEFDFNHPLFQLFLAKADAKQYSEFIKFIGRSYISTQQSSILKQKDSQWRVKRLKDFWDYMLTNKSDAAHLEDFGLWIKVEDGVFDLKWLSKQIADTLTKSNGAMDWDYGLMQSIETISEEYPKETLIILEKRLMFYINNEKDIFPIRDDKEWYRAFQILYNSGNKQFKDKTYKLINILIEKGSKPYWELEKIIEAEN